MADFLPSHSYNISRPVLECAEEETEYSSPESAAKLNLRADWLIKTAKK